MVNQDGLGVDLLAAASLGGVGLMAVGVGVTIYLAGYEARRGSHLAAYAARRGFAYRQRANVMLNAWFCRFPLFRTGHNRVIRNAMKGTYLNEDIRVFDLIADYRLPLSPASPDASPMTQRRDIRDIDDPLFNESSHTLETRHTTIVLYRLRDRRVPRFSLYPRRVAARREHSKQHARRIDIAGRSRFSRAFELRGVNPETIRAAFHRRTFEFLEHHPSLCVEAGGRWIMFYFDNHRPRANAEQFDGLLRVTGQAYRAFK